MTRPVSCFYQKLPTIQDCSDQIQGLVKDAKRLDRKAKKVAFDPSSNYVEAQQLRGCYAALSARIELLKRHFMNAQSKKWRSSENPYLLPGLSSPDRRLSELDSIIKKLGRAIFQLGYQLAIQTRLQHIISEPISSDTPIVETLKRRVELVRAEFAAAVTKDPNIKTTLLAMHVSEMQVYLHRYQNAVERKIHNANSKNALLSMHAARIERLMGARKTITESQEKIRAQAIPSLATLQSHAQTLHFQKVALVRKTMSQEQIVRRKILAARTGLKKLIKVDIEKTRIMICAHQKVDLETWLLKKEYRNQIEALYSTAYAGSSIAAREAATGVDPTVLVVKEDSRKIKADRCKLSESYQIAKCEMGKRHEHFLRMKREGLSYRLERLTTPFHAIIHQGQKEKEDLAKNQMEIAQLDVKWREASEAFESEHAANDRELVRHTRMLEDVEKELQIAQEEHLESLAMAERERLDLDKELNSIEEQRQKKWECLHRGGAIVSHSLLTSLADSRASTIGLYERLHSLE